MRQGHMMRIEQRYYGQYWVSAPGKATYTIGASEAARLLGYSIEEVRRLVVAVVELDDEVAA